MNKEWSEKNKNMQSLIKKEAGFKEGIDVLIELRNDLFSQITSIVETYPLEAFSKMPYAKAKGYHSKTLIYSMWHIFRIEDIVAHTLIQNDSQVLFTDGWLEKTNSKIITTGNELKDNEIVDFSKQLSVKAVYGYCQAVMDSTNEMLKKLKYKDLKRKFFNDDKERIINSDSVSSNEDAFWLIDYWCSKDIAGLIQMPFSRHWIMHIEAMLRIKNRLCEMARKGSDPIAFCGLSCDHCFLRESCGGCRTAYNTCSYATCSPNGVCPNTTCCLEKKTDGCYECEDIISCQKGFYENKDEINAIKAMSLFIRKYGKKELMSVLDELHEKYDFQKIQEILGYNIEEGLKILEENRQS